MRPTLAALPDRRAPALHRTLPTWAREASAEGKVVYRMYAPHAMGGAVFTIEHFDPDADRAEVAARLRTLRSVIWGRDKKVSAEVAARKREERAARMAMNSQAAGINDEASDSSKAASHGEEEQAMQAVPTTAPAPADVAANPNAPGALPPPLAQTVGEAEEVEQAVAVVNAATASCAATAPAADGDQSIAAGEAPALDAAADDASASAATATPADEAAVGPSAPNVAPTFSQGSLF